MTPQDFVSYVELADKSYQALKVDEAVAQAQVNDMLHVIEYLPLDAVKLSKCVKKLREFSRKRRELKEKRIYWENILQYVNTKAIDKYQHKEDNRNTRYLMESQQAYEKWIENIES